MRMKKLSIAPKLVDAVDIEDSLFIISKINGYYRYQILIKNKLSQKGHDFISKFIHNMTLPKDIKLTIDVDPLDIL